MNNRLQVQRSEYGTIPASPTPNFDDQGVEHDEIPQQQNQRMETILNICISVLNWYAFAIFGYLSDVLGQVFFGDKDGQIGSLVQSFAVFGVSFLVRPLGGLLFGYVGDCSSRHSALVSSVLLMAVATIFMGCLPTYDTAGPWSYRLLILARVLQGLAAGGQLMTSLVFGVEGYPKHQWGLMGSFVLTAANFGNFLSGVSVYWLRRHLTEGELATWGWRTTNLVSGTMLFFCGLVLKNIPRPLEVLDPQSSLSSTTSTLDTKPNPMKLAFAVNNRRSLLAASMVPVLGSSGFWLTFVWMAIYMVR
jgi:MHS family proline/betaine transporter-like MFS transporter